MTKVYLHDRRQRLAGELAKIEDREQRIGRVRRELDLVGIAVRNNGRVFHFRLYGRNAESTSHPDTAIGNWIAAALKEAGL